jgi:alkylation response protein AidB-like acyl-CoA dehydrogenase
MPRDLEARTDAGRRLVELAETLADDLATEAAANDRDGVHPVAGVGALRESGYLAAPIPIELGGMGVESVHDLLVASARLARGEPSLTIGANMHWIPLVNMAQMWRVARLAGDARRADGIGSWMERVAREGLVVSAAISEPAQDLTRPTTRARRTADGWAISGRKVFCTMSPSADVLYASVTYEDDEQGERYGYVRIAADAEGVRMHDDWDALGMRASGSNSVTFEDVRLPPSAVAGGFPAGRLSGDYVERHLVAGAFHAASSLGIAEEAARIAAEGATAGGRTPTPRTQTVAAEMSVGLSAMRATLQRAGALLDEHHVARAAGAHPSEDELVELFAEVQAAKVVLNEGAVRVVDQALALSGGAGYMTRHPLSRAYRDVRAGAFMHPLGANRAYDLLGELALGMEPTLR